MLPCAKKESHDPAAESEHHDPEQDYDNFRYDVEQALTLLLRVRTATLSTIKTISDMMWNKH